MDHGDITGIAAAVAALVLAVGGWMISPPRTEPPALAWAMPAAEDRGLDRWLDRLTEQQLARN